MHDVSSTPYGVAVFVLCGLLCWTVALPSLKLRKSIVSVQTGRLKGLR
jgi:hypothetical protein